MKHFSSNISNEVSQDKFKFESNFKQFQTKSMDSFTTLDSYNINESSLLNNNNMNEQFNISFPKKISYQEHIKKHLTNIRHFYFQTLINHNIMPINPRKKLNSIFIFDWDDTLLCSTFLAPNGCFDENIELSIKSKNKIAKLEKCVYKLLSLCIKKGDTFIITNAQKGWVEYSANRFYPKIVELLNNINIISARHLYEHVYPGNNEIWKREAFNRIVYQYNKNLITNIICIGDSINEIQAGKLLASNFENVCIKTIKFKQNPRIEDLKFQLLLIIEQFDLIFSTIKNWNITVEKKNNNKMNI